VLVLAIIYFILFCFFINKLSFFKDNKLSFKLILFILLIKAFGCLVYYWIYFNYYPGSFKNDSTSTMHDALVIYNTLPDHVFDYLKMIFGLHSNNVSDPLYNSYFQYIDKWGNSDSTSDFFLNDNRTSIRLNAFIMLFSRGNYMVHAFVMIAISFIGQFAFYKTFKEYFLKKEILLALVIFVTPSILFWTSGVLKEPLVVFLLGIFIYFYFQIFVHKQYKIKNVLFLMLSICFFIILKPYVILMAAVPLFIYKLVLFFKIKKVVLFYFFGIIFIYSLSITTFKYVFNKDVIQTIVNRQNDFVNLSKGGIFLLNKTKYVRLDVKDMKSVLMVDSVKMLCKIKPHSKLMYWDVNHINNLRDTLFDYDNQDTSIFHFHSASPPAGSGINISKLENSYSSFAKLIPLSLFNVFCRPFFYDSHSFTELIASLENLFILLFLLFCFINGKYNNKNSNLLACLICIVLLSFLLIGLTTTVTGAIVRYKAPFLPFLLMIPLLVLDADKLKRYSIIKRFVDTK